MCEIPKQLPLRLTLKKLKRLFGMSTNFSRRLSAPQPIYSQFGQGADPGFSKNLNLNLNVPQSNVNPPAGCARGVWGQARPPPPKKI